MYVVRVKKITKMLNRCVERFVETKIQNTEKIPELPYLPIQINDLGIKTYVFTAKSTN
jgi:hypothetical protein